MNPHEKYFDELIQKKLDDDLTTEEQLLLEQYLEMNPHWDPEKELRDYEVMARLYEDSPVPELPVDFKNRVLEMVHEQEEKKALPIAPNGVFAGALILAAAILAIFILRFSDIQDTSGTLLTLKSPLDSFLSGINSVFSRFVDIVAASIENLDTVGFEGIPSVGILAGILISMATLWVFLNYCFIRKIRAEL